MQMLGSPELEAEYLTSKILSGIIIPEDYSSIRVIFSELPYIEFGSFRLDLEQLKDNVFTSFGLVDDNEAEKYYLGNNEAVFKLLNLIKSKAEAFVPLFVEAQREASEKEFMQALAAIESAPDVLDISTYINSISEKSFNLQMIEKNTAQLEILTNKIDRLISLYGVSDIKLPRKKLEINNKDELTLFLSTLMANLENLKVEPIIIYKLVSAISALQANIPPNNLDPYKIDLMKNLYKELSTPKEFYKDCKIGNILDPIIGQTFYQVYPEFYSTYFQMYIDGYTNMSYQEQLTFKKCFGIMDDDGELISYCTRAIQLGYVT